MERMRSRGGILAGQLAISCGGGKLELAVRPRRLDRPCRRFGTSAATPGGSAPWPWAPSCWTACPCRSGAGAVAAACPGSNCLPPSRASASTDPAGRCQSPRACPWTAPPSATDANGLPDAAACSPALALPANQTPPSAAVDDAVGGALGAGVYVDRLVVFAPSLALAANLPPENQQTYRSG